MKTTSDLRNILIADLTALRNGNITRAEARARAQVARNILDTIKIEVASHAMNVSYYQPVLLDCEPTTFLEAAE
jgi:hypothetical protein